MSVDELIKNKPADDFVRFYGMPRLEYKAMKIGMKVLLLCQDLGIELDWEGNVIDEL